MAIGTEAQKINSQKYQLWVRNAGDSAEDEWVMLQNKRLLNTHNELREPTSSGGNVYYSGANDHVLSGTLLFTRDIWADGTYGIGALLTRSNGEVPNRKYKCKLVDSAGTTQTFTFNAKLQTADLNGPPEGATKIDVFFVITSDITQS